MSEKLVTIAQFPSYIEAEMAKQLLADYGIEAIVTGDNTSNVYSGLSALTDVELQVFESQAQEAIEILESQQQEPDEYDDNDDTDYDNDDYEEDDEDEEQW
jgi:hypothetical protein